MQGFLISLSGARKEILERCPTERIKFQSLGWAILITSTLATISMWFALTSALGANAFLALPVALAWGLIIMGIDRWLITSIPPSGSRRLALAAPRLLLAVLLGSIISTPLVLRVFQSEINAQIVVIKEQRANAYLTALTHSSITQQLSAAQARVRGLQKTIDSGGTVAPDPATDPVVISLTKQEDAEIKLEQKYYKQWQCQLYGGSGCPAKGDGVLAHASQSRYDNAVAQVRTLMSEIQAREKTLTATSAAADKTRLSQARAALPGAEQQLNAAQTRLDVLRKNFDQTNESTNGLLIRLQALSDLTNSSFTLGAARFLLFLLFLVIECLPVTVKLLQRPGNYEHILQVAQDRELKDAKQHFKTRLGRGDAQPVNFGTLSGGTLLDIWQPQTAKLDNPATAGTELEVDETEESTQLDQDALIEAADARAANGTVFPSGGIPLSWSDDER